MFRESYAHHQELSQTAVAASGFRINAEVDVFPAVVGYKPTAVCDCSLRELLKMGVMTPETC
jgi:hypothetical protein